MQLDQNDILCAEGRAAGKQLNLRARLPPTHAPKEAAARTFLQSVSCWPMSRTFLPSLTRVHQVELVAIGCSDRPAPEKGPLCFFAEQLPLIWYSRRIFDSASALEPARLAKKF
jgi:hypothetical protein